MDASSCVMGMKRFVFRWGTPAIIWSDNDANYLGAEKQLSEYIENWNTIIIAVEFDHKSIKLMFNPPSAPHQGGTLESLVRSFKRLPFIILGTRFHIDELVNTVFCHVEYALISRPLTSVSADPSDLGAITLNHFLISNQATAIPSFVGVDNVNHRKRYARAKSFAKNFWSRWIKEYVRALNRRFKWQTTAKQHLKTGDLFWVVEETNPSGYYPPARIIKLRYGSKCPVHVYLIARTPDCEIIIESPNLLNNRSLQKPFNNHPLSLKVLLPFGRSLGYLVIRPLDE